jgi:paired amphipathic helix protein Sin3a
LQKKTAQKAETPSGDEGELTGPIPGAPQTLASPDEVAFFDKVKKFIDDKVTYHEFLKLINLFVQDMIDTKMLHDRAELFIGNSPDVWPVFKKMIGADDMGNTGPVASSAQGGYGFGGMIGIDALVVENTPMLERVKPDLSGSKVKAYGPSYRKLPSSVSIGMCVMGLADMGVGGQSAMYGPRFDVLGGTQRRVGVAPYLGGGGCCTVHGTQEESIRGAVA